MWRNELGGGGNSDSLGGLICGIDGVRSRGSPSVVSAFEISSLACDAVSALIARVEDGDIEDVGGDGVPSGLLGLARVSI